MYAARHPLRLRRHPTLLVPVLRLLPLLLLFSVAALAQAPSADWKTIDTPHFRIHFPGPYEPWARAVAGRVEPIRERMIATVGYAPPQVVDVVIQNPVAATNGEALTLLNGPRLVLWAESPDPASELGNYSDWIDLLVTHEVTHLVHLLRPSRNLLRRAGQRLLPLGPLNFAPRWVLEGYATVIEGRLTGSGRPYGSYRAAVLRRWAQQGRLPSYAALDSGADSFLGLSMAYLAGSAYLEWLETRPGAPSLENVWARLTARRARSFDDAFTGVFGDTPRHLYACFTAELTASAIDTENLLTPTLREGALWQETTWSTGAPALSPDGTRLALVLHAKDAPPRLVVLATTPPLREEAAYRKRIEETLRRDPDDVPPRRDQPIDRKPIAEYTAANGRNLRAPRWLPDGRSLLFTHNESDADGFLHGDLFRWWPDSGRIERLTRLADLRDPDPLPDGRTAVAVRSRFGFTQLVTVSLADGAIRELTSPSLTSAESHPRVSPDGRFLAYATHRDAATRLAVRDAASGAERVAEAPAPAVVAEPSWSRDGRTLFASVASGGVVEVDAFPLETLVGAPVTRSRGAALAPEATPEGGLYFLALEPAGLSVRKLERVETLSPPPAIRSLIPAMPVSLLPAAGPPSTAPAHEYHLGHQERFALLGGGASPSGQSVEAGLRSGDVIGRLDVVVLAAIGSGDVRNGAAVGAQWRGLPVQLSIRLFHLDERPGSQSHVGSTASLLDATHDGGELRFEWMRHTTLSLFRATGGFLAGRIRPAQAGSRSQSIVFLESGWSHDRAFGALHLQPSLAGGVDRGSTGGDVWTRVQAAADLSVGTKAVQGAIGYERGSVSGRPSAFDRFQLGGVEGSIAPGSSTSGRVFEPALPVAILDGNRHGAFRARLELQGLPTVFYTRHEIGSGAAPHEAMRLAGVRYELRGEAIPLVRLPAYTLTVGVARILDAPLRNRNAFWLGLAWRP